MIVQDVINHLHDLAPLAYAEDFDNVGLLVGNKDQPVSGILVTLDTLEAVVDEAIDNNCNLIVSFHPIIFKGLKKITGKTYVERVVIKAIKHNIAIFSIHTALDNAIDGVQFIKTKMNTECIRHSKLIDKPIKSIAVLGGSGSFAINAAKASGADLLITADLKYHDFFSAENAIILADIGHYESEQFTKTFLVDYLSKKITNFAIILSKTNTNPIKYL